MYAEELLEEKFWKFGYEAVKRIENHYWLNLKARGDLRGQGNIHYGLLSNGKGHSEESQFFISGKQSSA